MLQSLPNTGDFNRVAKPNIKAKRYASQPKAHDAVSRCKADPT